MGKLNHFVEHDWRAQNLSGLTTKISLFQLEHEIIPSSIQVAEKCMLSYYSMYVYVDITNEIHNSWNPIQSYMNLEQNVHPHKEKNAHSK